MSDDHQHLLMSEDVQSWLFGTLCYVYNYKYNSTSEEFYLIKTYTFFGTYSNYASLSVDEYFMTFSGSTKTLVQSDFLGSGLNL